MENKKVEGTTNYIFKGNSVQKLVKDTKSIGRVICECLFCGERFGGNSGGGCAMYCKNCRTADQRKKVAEENAKI